MKEEKYIQMLCLDMIVEYVKNTRFSSFEQSWLFKLSNYSVVLTKYGNSYYCSPPQKI
jgi:hypothetical protein